jgi:hypothetical protein
MCIEGCVVVLCVQVWRANGRVWRATVEAPKCGPSFTRFGSTIWTKSRPRTGARITIVLSVVCIAACGGKGSLLGSHVRPTAVKPMGAEGTGEEGGRGGAGVRVGVETGMRVACARKTPR